MREKSFILVLFLQSKRGTLQFHLMQLSAQLNLTIEREESFA